MKVRVYALFALMALTAAAQAQERISDSYVFRVGAGFGMLFGESRELVYRSPDTEDLESLLQWHLEPLVCYKSVLEFKRTEPLLGFGVNAGLNVSFGFDGNTGKMTDKDWDVDTGELWSDTTHAIRTDGAVMVDGKVGLTWPLFNLVTLGVSLKASYLSFNCIEPEIECSLKVNR
jgi:outer membrane protease